MNVELFVIDRYKSLIAGSKGLYRFPILQYLPVYLAGLITGRHIKKAGQIEDLVLAALSNLFIILSSLTNYKLASFPYSEEFQRWPPAISFISLGMGFSLISLSILRLLSKFQVIKWAKPLILIGKNALSIYVVHIVVLQISQTWLSISVSSPLLLVFSFVIVLALSYTLTYLIKYKYNDKKQN